MASAKQKLSAQKNIQKAQQTWRGMSRNRRPRSEKRGSEISRRLKPLKESKEGDWGEI